MVDLGEVGFETEGEGSGRVWLGVGHAEGLDLLIYMLLSWGRRLKVPSWKVGGVGADCRGPENSELTVSRAEKLKYIN